ncbi:uncharacterized protein STEHIDRAFT_152180 [Stereum hirsutum FP-91666 SS1]|uniref:uncharacterized protein n=1 Tax=Stereum hirsutum (strain FP-91666) TaxID=721885 RepID=UPI000440D00F|nr:uncharacterized protein STEHIDRAFT_152180 [Stereum hirsutum FP-91666 SS1]EIM92879.1 hypothetical protein STEHIDRAFT_152180 [Stereum hirsutum FP-91666 SS1]
MLLLGQIILWLSYLALVTTPMLNSFPFELIKTLSPATNFIGLLSGATDSLPRLPIADLFPVLNMSGLWYQRSDLEELLMFQVAFIPTMAAIVLAIVLLLITHIDDERLAELFLGRIDEHLSTRIDAIHIQVSQNVAVVSPHRRTRKHSSRKGNSVPLRVVEISRDATTCLNHVDENARELELDALVGFKTYGQIPSNVTAPIESLGHHESFEEPLEEYRDMASEVEVVVNVLVSGVPTPDSTTPPPLPLPSPTPSVITTLAPITTSSHETAVQQSEDPGSTPTTPGETEGDSIPTSTAASTPDSTSSDIIATTTPDLPTPSVLAPDAVANLENVDGDELDTQDVNACFTGGNEMVHDVVVPSTGSPDIDRPAGMLMRSAAAKSLGHDSSTVPPVRMLTTAIDPTMPGPGPEFTGMKIDIQALLSSAPAHPTNEQPTATSTNKFLSALFPGHRESEDHFASRESEKDASTSSTDSSSPSSGQSVSLPHTDSSEIIRPLSPPDAPTTPRRQRQENPAHGLDSAPDASPASDALSSGPHPPGFKSITIEELSASERDRKTDATDGEKQDNNSDAQPSPAPITPSVYHPVDVNLLRRRPSLPDLGSVFLAELDDTNDSEDQPVNRVVFRERTPLDFRSHFFFGRRRSDSPLSDHHPDPSLESSSAGPISEDERDEILSKLLPAHEIDYDADESDFEDDDDDADDWDFHPNLDGATPFIPPAPIISSDPAPTIPTAPSPAPASTIPTSLSPTLPAGIPRPRIPYTPLKKPGTFSGLWDAAHAAHSKGQTWLAARLLPERFPMFWSPTARSWADEVEEDMFREALDAKLIGEGGRVLTAEELASVPDGLESDCEVVADEVEEASLKIRARDDMAKKSTKFFHHHSAPVHRFVAGYHFVDNADLDYRAGLSGRSTSRRGTP